MPAESEARRFAQVLLERFHYDFRGYAPTSFRRRLGAALRKLDCASVAELQDRLLGDDSCLPVVLDHLTVQVSAMFRDPSYFRSLRESVLPLLRTYPSIRVWVAGCSTGEEAYSLAILLREAGLLERSLVYATDINPRALEAAASGVYALDQLADFSRNYRLAGGTASLADHYVEAYGRAVLDRSLRERIVFTDHSLATDSVFAEVQLVSCRNVLIYFDRTLQDRALGLFHESLCRRGFLGLGARESLQFSAYAEAFAELVPDDRLYQRRERAR